MRGDYNRILSVYYSVLKWRGSLYRALVHPSSIQHPSPDPSLCSPPPPHHRHVQTSLPWSTDCEKRTVGIRLKCLLVVNVCVFNTRIFNQLIVVLYQIKRLKQLTFWQQVSHVKWRHDISYGRYFCNRKGHFLKQKTSQSLRSSHSRGNSNCILSPCPVNCIRLHRKDQK